MKIWERPEMTDPQSLPTDWDEEEEAETERIRKMSVQEKVEMFFELMAKSEPMTPEEEARYWAEKESAMQVVQERLVRLDRYRNERGLID